MYAANNLNKFFTLYRETDWYNSLLIVINLQQVIGTDAPYLTPFNMEKPFPPHNEPSTLPHVLIKLAECVKVNVTELARITTEVKLLSHIALIMRRILVNFLAYPKYASTVC